MCSLGHQHLQHSLGTSYYYKHSTEASALIVATFIILLLLEIHSRTCTFDKCAEGSALKCYLVLENGFTTLNSLLFPCRHQYYQQ